jgi:uncharacterized protein (DUF2384 family)
MGNLAISAFLDSPTSAFLSPQKVALRLSMSVEELAESAHVHRNSLRVHPQAPRIQTYLRQVVRVLVAAEAIFGSRDTAALWMRNEPLPPFKHRTAIDMINMNRTDDVIEYLASIAPGFVG